MGNRISTHILRPMGIVEGIPLLNDPGSPSGSNNHTIEINRLARILLRRSFAMVGVIGISRHVFVDCVFSDQPELGSHIFNYMHVNAKARTPNYLDPVIFREQCELLVSISNPAERLEIFVKMFCAKVKKVTPIEFRALLVASYELTTANYPPVEISENYRITVERIFQSIITSCYSKQKPLKIDLVCRWIDENLPHLIPPMFKFTVYRLTTAYRKINASDIVKNAILYFLRVNDVFYDDVTEIDIRIPKLNVVNYENPPALLCRARAWLLSCVLPAIYCKPKLLPEDESYESVLKNRNELTKENCMKIIAAALPADWAILYDIETNGKSVRAFSERVRHYQGASLCLISFKDTDNNIEYLFCYGTSVQWKEAHLYVGDENCYLIQLLPKFVLLETGPELLNYNSSVYGFQFGLYFGRDYYTPIIAIDEFFDGVTYNRHSYESPKIAVWGCNSVQSYMLKVDFKRWRAREFRRLTKLTEV